MANEKEGIKQIRYCWKGGVYLATSSVRDSYSSRFDCSTACVARLTDFENS
jgi:hypothetical protein